MSDLIEDRLWLPPRQAHVDQKCYQAHERSVEHEARFDATANPDRENEGKSGGSNQDRGQKGLLAEEVARGKDDGEDTQFRQETAH